MGKRRNNENSFNNKDNIVQKKMRKHFNGISHHYYDIVNQFPFTYGYYHKKELGYVMKIVKMHNLKKILDVGCATGKNLNELRSVSPNSLFYGADFSFEMIEFARKQYPDMFFVQSDITNLGFKNKSFDLVYSLEVLEHLPNKLEDVEKAIKELIRVTKPNGVILFEFTNIIHSFISGALSLFLKTDADVKYNLPDRIYKEIYVKNPLIVANAYSLSSILKILKKIDVDLVDIRYIGFIPQPIYGNAPISFCKTMSKIDSKLENKIFFNKFTRESVIILKKY